MVKDGRIVWARVKLLIAADMAFLWNLLRVKDCMFCLTSGADKKIGFTKYATVAGDTWG